MSDLRFVSTRGNAPPVTLSEAIAQGLAPDGGLYVPTRLPAVDTAALAGASGLPQIARASLPGLVNEMSLLIKVTPVLAVVGVVDITRAAVRIGAQTYEPLPPFLVAVALYAPIVFALVSLQRWIERRQVAAEAAA